MNEIWKSVPGWEGYYEVSSLGRVRSVPRVVVTKRGVKVPLPGRIRRQHPDPKWGHLRVWLLRDGRRRHYLVHRLVLLAFVGPCPDGMEGCHNDGNPANNHPSNLRWDTQSSNTLDQVRHGCHNMASKTHCKHGHEFTPQNTYVNHRGHRACRTCRNKYSREYQARKRAAA